MSRYFDSGALFSRGSDDWETPDELYNELDMEFGFTLDACADAYNHKCQTYFDKEQDGLSRSWEGHCVWCNPPYSEISRWTEKCFREGCKDNTTVVLLIPSRTDTKYFHNFINNRAEIRFIKGRLRFGGSQNYAPFPSMIVIFRGAYSK